MSVYYLRAGGKNQFIWKIEVPLWYTIYMNGETPICQICNKAMGRAGLATSGTTKIQRYRCNHCGRTTTKLNRDITNHNHHNRHIIDLTDLEEAQIQVRSIKANMSVEQFFKSLTFREHQGG
jgi:transposase-like protein